MADKNDGGDKTEQPTPKKLLDARKKGQVPKSKDLSSTVELLVWFGLAVLALGPVTHELGAVMEAALVSIGQPFAVAAPRLAAHALQALLLISAWLLLPVAAVGVLTEFLQAGPVFALDKVKPKLENMNPVEGVKRMFTMDNLVEVAKAVAKTALLLAKHRAFSPMAAQSLVRSLVMELIARTHDERSLEKLWMGLPLAQKALPEVVAQAATRWLQLGGDPVRARAWLLPVWEAMLAGNTGRTLMDQQKLVQVLEMSMKDAPSPDARHWLARIEAAQQLRPNDAYLQYLAGMVYLRHQLWGKAQHLLGQAVKGLPDATLQRRAWSSLAELAEQRDDPAAALQAWKQAARLG